MSGSSSSATGCSGWSSPSWLYERYPNEPEGQLSRRYNALVARETCAEIGREIGLPALIRLGKQARDDGASESDNVVGDVVEALIGALFLDAGLEAAQRFILAAWAPLLEGQGRAPEHPKSALQELAAARELQAARIRAGRAAPAPTTRRVHGAGVGAAARRGGGRRRRASRKPKPQPRAALLEQLK